MFEGVDLVLVAKGLVGGDGFVEPPFFLVGQTQVQKRLRIVRILPDGVLQFGNGLIVLSQADQILTGRQVLLRRLGAGDRCPRAARRS